MANYTIIGGDHKEYGPVTGEEIRQWIVEGRLDGNSQVRGENDAAWRPLSAFPEFASSFQPRPASPPPFGASPVAARSGGLPEVKAPAIGVIVIGILGVLVALSSFVSAFAHPASVDQMLAQWSAVFPSLKNPDVQRQLHDPQLQKMLDASSGGGIAIATAVFNLVMSGVVVWGGTRMLAGRSYELACLAAILILIPCVIPCPCCCAGLPVGIWALMILRKPEIKGQFR